MPASGELLKSFGLSTPPGQKDENQSLALGEKRRSNRYAVSVLRQTAPPVEAPHEG
jgi:hypothetical protein